MRNQKFLLGCVTIFNISISSGVNASISADPDLDTIIVTANGRESAREDNAAKSANH